MASNNLDKETRSLVQGVGVFALLLGGVFVVALVVVAIVVVVVNAFGGPKSYSIILGVVAALGVATIGFRRVYGR